MNRLIQQEPLHLELEVQAFLDSHPHLAELLHEAQSEIQGRFPEAQLTLELFTDPERPSKEQLVITIVTDLPRSEAFARLRNLDDQWWLERAADVYQNMLITLG